eukprot:g6751.t1
MVRTLKAPWRHCNRKILWIFGLRCATSRWTGLTVNEVKHPDERRRPCRLGLGAGVRHSPPGERRGVPCRDARDEKKDFSGLKPRTEVVSTDALEKEGRRLQLSGELQRATMRRREMTLSLTSFS